MLTHITTDVKSKGKIKQVLQQTQKVTAIQVFLLWQKMSVHLAKRAKNHIRGTLKHPPVIPRVH